MVSVRYTWTYNTGFVITQVNPLYYFRQDTSAVCVYQSRFDIVLIAYRGLTLHNALYLPRSGSYDRIDVRLSYRDWVFAIDLIFFPVDNIAVLLSVTMVTSKSVQSIKALLSRTGH